MGPSQPNISDLYEKWDLDYERISQLQVELILDDAGGKLDFIDFDCPIDTITDINFDGKKIMFTRKAHEGPDYDQKYVGEVSSDKMTMIGTYQQVLSSHPAPKGTWSATKIKIG